MPYNGTPRSRTPVVLSLAGFSGELPDEDAAIRQAVDEALSQCEKNAVAVSGMTIFPYDLWQHRGRPPWEKFHPLCVKRFFPRLKACDARNRLGTYFERMMNFTGQRGGEAKDRRSARLHHRLAEGLATMAAAICLATVVF